MAAAGWVLILLTLLASGGLRLVEAESRVAGAGRAASRAAATTSDRGSAEAVAERIVAQRLGPEGGLCAEWEVTVSGDPQAGESVTVEVGCRLDLRVEGPVGLPAAVTVEHTAHEIVDRHRGGG